MPGDERGGPHERAATNTTHLPASVSQLALEEVIREVHGQAALDAFVELGARKAATVQAMAATVRAAREAASLAGSSRAEQHYAVRSVGRQLEMALTGALDAEYAELGSVE